MSNFLHGAKNVNKEPLFLKVDRSISSSGGHASQKCEFVLFSV